MKLLRTTGWVVLVIVEVLLIGFVAKVMLMLGSNDAGRAAYARGDREAAESAFEPNLVLNRLEPWVAWFNRATARHARGAWDPAIQDYRSALRVVPQRHRCTVVDNLSAAYRSAAEELISQGNTASAQELTDRARRLDPDDACGEDEADAPQDSESSESSEGGEDATPPSLTDSQGSDRSRDRELAQRQRQGRAAREQHRNSTPPSTDGGSNDQPW